MLGGVNVAIPWLLKSLISRKDTSKGDMVVTVEEKVLDTLVYQMFNSIHHRPTIMWRF